MGRFSRMQAVDIWAGGDEARGRRPRSRQRTLGFVSALALVVTGQAVLGGAAHAGPAQSPPTLLTGSVVSTHPMAVDGSGNVAGNVVVSPGGGAPGGSSSFAMFWPSGQLPSEIGFSSSGMYGRGLTSAAVAMNDSDQVVGWGTTASGARHAFLWSPSTGIKDLGTLGGSTSAASAISDNGIVVGTSTTSAGATDAFEWTASGGMVDLGLLNSTSSSPSPTSTSATDPYPAGVNSSGEVVGYETMPSGYQHGFLWNPSTGLTDLTPAGYDYSHAYVINDAGQVAGDAGIASSSENRAFVWSAGSFTFLDSFESTDPHATAINAGGEVVGYDGQTAFEWDSTNGYITIPVPNATSTMAEGVSDAGVVLISSPQGPYAWTNAGGPVALSAQGASAGDGLWATAISHNGEWAVGSAVAPASPGLDPQTTALLWHLAAAADGGPPTQLGGSVMSTRPAGVDGKGDVAGNALLSPDGRQNTQVSSFAMYWPVGQPRPSELAFSSPIAGQGLTSGAVAMNDSDQVVGWATTASGAQHAFLWSPSTGMNDLGTLGGATSTASAISDNGIVVGTSTTATGATDAFEWTASGGMVDIGLLAVSNGSSSPSFASNPYPAGVNSSGDVAGYETMPSGAQHAFFWDPASGLTDLTPPGDAYSHAFAINDAGQVAGDAGLANGGGSEAYAWSVAGGYTVFNSARPEAINANGEVTGFSGQLAFAWDPAAGYTTIDPSGFSYSDAPALSDSGVVALNASGPSPGTAYTWTAAGGPVALSEQGLPAGDATVASAISHNGDWVAGSATAPFNPNGAQQATAVVWRLTETPTSMLASASPTGTTYGNTVDLSVTGLPTGASGTVTFAAGGSTLCAATLPATGCTTAVLAPATYTVTATYSGDATYAGSTAGTGFTVDQAVPASPTITNLPSAPYVTGSFTAVVSPTDAGTPSVASTTPAQCSVGPDGLTVTFEAVGTCTLTPAVAGDTDYLQATGAPVNLTVAPDVADVSVDLGGPTQAADGTSFDESVTVTDHGPAPAGGVAVTMTVPDGVTVTSTGGGTRYGQLIVWKTGTVAPGQPETLTATFAVDKHTNRAVAVLAAALPTTLPDPNWSDNIAWSTIVLGRYPVSWGWGSGETR